MITFSFVRSFRLAKKIQMSNIKNLEVEPFQANSTAATKKI